jgi:hypothetical protein
MLCEPPARLLTVRDATPLVNVAVPSVVEPSLNVTDPVALALETVAFSVVLAPNVMVAGVAVTTVVVDAGVTVTVIAALVEPEKLLSPE